MEDNVFLSVVVPVYNEEKTITGLHREILRMFADAYPEQTCEVLFINDGSTDETDTVLRGLHPVTYVRFEKNYGQTAALDCGFHLAKGTYIAALDGDGQNDPADIPKLLACLIKEGLDAVCGRRRGRKDPPGRKILTFGAYLFRQLLLHDGIHDSGCTLKVFRRECFAHIYLRREQHRLIPAILKREGFRIGESDVHHRARMSGKTKYRHHKRIWHGLADIWDLRFGKGAGRRPEDASYTVAEIVRNV